MKESLNFPSLYYKIAEVIKPSRAYLVGGAVRDLLLKKEIHDLDFALPEGTISTAKKIADRLKGDFFILDKERQTARVILQPESDPRLVVDFTTFQGDSIEEDLQTRDFTITSMAIDIHQEDQIIDPCQGAQDLKDGLIRSTSTHALRDDPLRGIRAVRMAAQFGFLILPDTKEQIRKTAKHLSEASPERIRDEIFRILDGPHQGTALQALQILGLYPQVITNPYTPEQAATIRHLEALWSLLREEHNQETAANWAFGLVAHRLGRYRKEIQLHLDYQPVVGRTIYQLSFLDVLLSVSVRLVKDPKQKNNSQYSSPAENLHLSNQEHERLKNGNNAGKAFRHLTDMGETLSPLTIYQYFREFSDAGVEGIFLALAGYLAVENQAIQQTGWMNQLNTARSLLEGWWEKRERWVDPPGLINGNDLQEELGIDPGPEIGRLLEKLREAQVRDNIQTRERAWEYLRQSLETEGLSGQ